MANKTKGNKNISDIYPKQRVSFPESFAATALR